MCDHLWSSAKSQIEFRVEVIHMYPLANHFIWDNEYVEDFADQSIWLNYLELYYDITAD